MQTVSRELEEEALIKESEADKLLKALAAASAAAERRRLEELKAKDQQIAELQVQLWLMHTRECMMILILFKAVLFHKASAECAGFKQ